MQDAVVAEPQMLARRHADRKRARRGFAAEERAVRTAMRSFLRGAAGTASVDEGRDR